MVLEKALKSIKMDQSFPFKGYILTEMPPIFYHFQ